jgi:hypothetical protein
MSNIDLLLDEENELTFALKIEGTRPAAAKCRLILENKGMSLVFDSEDYDGEEVSVVLPPLGHVLKEGEYNMNLEVIVEDRFFKPLELVGNFEKSITIVAEKIERKKASLSPKVTLSNVKVRKSQKKEALKEPVQAQKVVKESKSKTKLTDKDIMALIEALKSR